MMEISCHTWAFNDLTLPEALGTIARLGFRYVDIGTGPHLNPARAANPATRSEVLREIRADLAAFNLKLADLYFMLPRISVNDEEKRQRDLATFRALLPFAKSLGTPGITVSSGLVHPDEDSEAADRTVAALREMQRAAAEAGVTLSVEPHLDSMTRTVEQALKLVKDVPGLRLTLDWAQFICQNTPLAEVARLMPHVRHVQLRQAARNQLQLPFERGRLDVAKALQVLHQHNYSGHISVEYMQTVGWHGMVAVNSIVEVTTMRDAVREARAALS